MGARQQLLYLAALLVFARIEGVQSDLHDEAAILLVELREVIQGNIDSGVLKLHGHEEDISESADTFQQLGQAQIQVEYNTLIAKLDNIKQSSSEAHLNITACLDQYEDQLPQLFDTVNNHLIVCITEEHDTISYIVKRALKALNETIGWVQNLENELDYCGLDELCIAEVIGKIPGQQEELTERVVQIVDTAVVRIDDAFQSFEQCGVVQITTIIGDGGRILDEIEQCINSLSAIV